VASKRVCPHTITIFNFIGEDPEGNAMYAAAVLSNVHAHINEGMGAGDVSNDKTRVHIFDDTVECEKSFLPHGEWNALPEEEKVKFWTLCPEGKDYFSQGSLQQYDPATPTNAPVTLPRNVVLFRIMLISRLQMGRPRMWHWRVEAR